MQQIKQIREHQYFELMAAGAFLVLALAAYYIFFNRSYLVVITDKPEVTIAVDNKIPENIIKKENKNIIKLWPGIHTIRLTSPNTVEYAQTITFYRGFARTINPALNLIPKAAEKASGDIKFLTAGNKNDLVYYLGEGGSTIFKHNLKTNSRVALTGNNLLGILNINFSPDFKLALLEKKNGIYLYDFGRYDLLNQEEFFLGSADEMTMPDWDPKAETNCQTSNADCPKRIAYFRNNSSGKVLVYANQLNQNSEVAADLSGMDKPNIVWSPDGKSIAVFDHRKIAILDVVTRELTLVDMANKINGAKFSPDGRFLLYSSNSFILYNLKTKDKKSLGIDTTIDRLVFSNDSNFLVAVIFDKSKGLDQFKQIDIRSGTVTNYLYSSPNPVRVEKAILNKQETSILFQSNNRLYSLFLQTEK